MVGDPFDSGTDIGPIVTEAQRGELVGQIDEARRQGATVHAGAKVPAGDGWYFAADGPLGHHAGHARCAQEEIFGPVAVVGACPTSTAAIAAANATTFGLGSSVWTNDAAEIAGASRRSRPGRCSSTPWSSSMPEMPFGGIKRSGYGRELSELGIKEFCNAKSVWIA